MEVGGSVRGEIESPGDLDWFAVTLTAGATYQIDLKGSGTGDGTLWDTYLAWVYDESGSPIAGTEADDGGEGVNSRVEFTPTARGTYYVAAGASGSETGTYTLSVMDLTDDYSATRRTTGAVDVDGSVTGEIDYRGDRDWFAVNLTAGTTYRIDLKGLRTGDGTLYDPYLYGIYDRNGNRLAGTDGRRRGRGLQQPVDVHAVRRTGSTTWRPALVDLTDAKQARLRRCRSSSDGGHDLRIDLKGSRTGDGPYPFGVYPRTATSSADTRNDDRRLTTGGVVRRDHYVAAGGYGGSTGTYTLSVVIAESVRPDDDIRPGPGPPARWMWTARRGARSTTGAVTGSRDPGGGRDLRDLPGGLADRGGHPEGPVPARGLRRNGNRIAGTTERRRRR